MKLLNHLKKLVDTNNLKQFEIDCKRLDLLQDAISEDKYRLFDYQTTIDELVVYAAGKPGISFEFLTKLLQSNPSKNALFRMMDQFLNNPNKKLQEIFFHSERVRNIPLEDLTSSTGKIILAYRILDKALQYAKQELGWLQSNTYLITTTLKQSLEQDSGALKRWLDELLSGDRDNPFNEKQWGNFKNALKALPIVLENLNGIPHSKQLSDIQNRAQEIIGQLNQHNNLADVIWYLQHYSSSSADTLNRKNAIEAFLIEHDIPLKFYLDNPLKLNVSLAECDKTIVRKHFHNALMQKLENRHIIQDDQEWTEVTTSIFIDPTIFKYEEIPANKLSTDKIMESFSQHHKELTDLIYLVSLKGHPLLHCAVMFGSNNISLFKGCAQIDINEKVPGVGKRALQWAAEVNPSALETLIDFPGVDLHVKNDNHQTIFEIAQSHQSANMQVLVNHKAFDLNMRFAGGDTPLLYALHNNQKNLVEQLIAKNVNPNLTNNWKQNALHIAANRCPSAIKALLQIKGVNKNALDQNNHTPLIIAQNNNNEDAMLEFLADDEIQFNIYRFDQRNNSLFQCALVQKYKRVIELLLTKNLDLRMSNKLGLNALHIAVNYYPEAINTLIEKGININSADNNCLTALHHALQHDKQTAFELLISHPDINVNAKDINGNTPLHYATMHNRFYALDKLLAKQNIFINERNKNQMTPLALALTHSPKMIEKLITTQGIDVNVKANNGDTPLHMAIVSLHDLIEPLLKIKGINVNVFNSAGDTPLHAAVIVKPSVIPLLAKMDGFNPNLVNGRGDTALHYAAVSRKGYQEAITELVKCKGIQLYIRNKEGETALHTAVKDNGYTTQYLLENGFDVNARNSRKATALHTVIYNKYYALETLLAAPNIDINAVDDDGDTPLHCAAMLNPDEIEKLLKIKGIKVNIKNNSKKIPLDYLDPQHKAYPLLAAASKKERETYHFTNMSDFAKLFADKTFMQLVLQQKAENIVAISEQIQIFGIHTACNAVCHVINHCKNPGFLTTENWVLGQLKIVITERPDMLAAFLTLFMDKQFETPFLLHEWNTWMKFVGKAIAINKANEALQQAFEALRQYTHPQTPQQKPEVVSHVVVKIVPLEPTLSADETTEIQKRVQSTFAEIAKKQPDLIVLDQLRSLGRPDETESAQAALNQSKKRLEAKKWCASNGFQQFIDAFDRPADFVNGDQKRAHLALNLLRETVLVEVAKIIAVPASESKHVLFATDSSQSHGIQRSDVGFLNSRQDDDNDDGQELQPFSISNSR